jgi:hypothetical protein
VTCWNETGVNDSGEHCSDRACAVSGMEEHRCVLLERVPGACVWRLSGCNLPRESCVSCQRGSRQQVTGALVHTIELRRTMVVPADERTKVTLEEKKRFAEFKKLKEEHFHRETTKPSFTNMPLFRLSPLSKKNAEWTSKNKIVMPCRKLKKEKLTGKGKNHSPRWYRRSFQCNREMQQLHHANIPQSPSCNNLMLS